MKMVIAHFTAAALKEDNQLKLPKLFRHYNYDPNKRI